MLGQVQRWAIPGPGHRVEYLVFWLASLWDLPMRPGETLSLTVTLPNEQRIVVPEAVVRWSRGQEFVVENVVIEPQTHARLQHYVKRLVHESTEIHAKQGNYVA
jgi:hypothetical protein